MFNFVGRQFALGIFGYNGLYKDTLTKALAFVLGAFTSLVILDTIYFVVVTTLAYYGIIITGYVALLALELLLTLVLCVIGFYLIDLYERIFGEVVKQIQRTRLKLKSP